MNILYITGNEGKIRVAKKYLEPLGIEITQKPLELEEMQSHNLEEITLHKARQAFSLLNHPLLVNDAGWAIPALNGFPGAYMRYINEWLTANDFLNLMSDKEDRTIIFTEYFCYIDKKGTKLFTHTAKGTILKEMKGSRTDASWAIVSLREDGKTISESWDEGLEPVMEYTVWEEFASWYKSHNKS